MKDTTKTILVLVGIFALLVASVVLFFVDRKNNEITIIDKTGDVCGEALLYFYQDSQYKYYFDCLKEILSQGIFLMDPHQGRCRWLNQCVSGQTY